MFGIGLFEFLLILLSILVFVRPKDLPKFFYQVGKIYGEIRTAYYTVLREINLLSDRAKEMIEQDPVEDVPPEDSPKRNSKKKSSSSRIILPVDQLAKKEAEKVNNGSNRRAKIKRKSREKKLPSKKRSESK